MRWKLFISLSWDSLELAGNTGWLLCPMSHPGIYVSSILLLCHTAKYSSVWWIWLTSLPEHTSPREGKRRNKGQGFFPKNYDQQVAYMPSACISLVKTYSHGHTCLAERLGKAIYGGQPCAQVKLKRFCNYRSWEKINIPPYPNSGRALKTALASRVMKRKCFQCLYGWKMYPGEYRSIQHVANEVICLCYLLSLLCKKNILCFAFLKTVSVKKTDWSMVSHYFFSPT